MKKLLVILFVNLVTIQSTLANSMYTCLATEESAHERYPKEMNVEISDIGFVSIYPTEDIYYYVGRLGKNNLKAVGFDNFILSPEGFVALTKTMEEQVDAGALIINDYIPELVRVIYFCSKNY